MEKQDYTHYVIKGLIALDMIACTRETTRRTSLRYTEVLDECDCPECSQAIQEQTEQYLQREERRRRNREKGP